MRKLATLAAVAALALGAAACGDDDDDDDAPADDGIEETIAPLGS